MMFKFDHLAPFPLFLEGTDSYTVLSPTNACFKNSRVPNSFL